MSFPSELPELTPLSLLRTTLLLNTPLQTTIANIPSVTTVTLNQSTQNGVPTVPKTHLDQPTQNDVTTVTTVLMAYGRDSSHPDRSLPSSINNLSCPCLITLPLLLNHNEHAKMHIAESNEEHMPCL